jgi:hypothetical protein
MRGFYVAYMIFAGFLKLIKAIFLTSCMFNDYIPLHTIANIVCQICATFFYRFHVHGIIN